MARFVPARRTRSGEELRTSESEAGLLPLSSGGQSNPFHPCYESAGSCYLRSQTSELWKKGFNQSAPYDFRPAPGGGKEDHQSMESPVFIQSSGFSANKGATVNLCIHWSFPSFIRHIFIIHVNLSSRRFTNLLVNLSSKSQQYCFPV